MATASADCLANAGRRAPDPQGTAAFRVERGTEPAISLERGGGRARRPHLQGPTEAAVRENTNETIEHDDARRSLWSTHAVTFHALARYREHFPDADEAAVRDDLAFATRIAPEVARSLVGRRTPVKSATPSVYLLSAERRGVFVVSRGESATTVITYLPCGDAEAQFARAHWG